MDVATIVAGVVLVGVLFLLFKKKGCCSGSKGEGHSHDKKDGEGNSCCGH